MLGTGVGIWAAFSWSTLGIGSLDCRLLCGVGCGCGCWGWACECPCCWAAPMSPSPGAGLLPGPVVGGGGIKPGRCDARLTAAACVRGRMLALAVVGVAD